MDKRKTAIIEDLESRLTRLPVWQKNATLECIDILENQDPTDEEIYLNLRTAGHFDLADLFLPKKEKRNQYRKVQGYRKNETKTKDK